MRRTYNLKLTLEALEAITIAMGYLPDGMLSFLKEDIKEVIDEIKLAVKHPAQITIGHPHTPNSTCGMRGNYYDQDGNLYAEIG